MKQSLYWMSVLVSGMLFGAGLTLSTMIQPEAIFSFLLFDNFGLLLVLGAATGITMLVYQVLPRLKSAPFLSSKFSSRPNETLKRTLIGAVLFGIGWGLSGVCPGPAIAGLGSANWPLLYALSGMIAGAYVQGRWFN